MEKTIRTLSRVSQTLFNRNSAAFVWIALCSGSALILLQIDYQSPKEEISGWMLFGRLFGPLLFLNCLGIVEFALLSRFSSVSGFRLHMFNLSAVSSTVVWFGAKYHHHTHLWWWGYENWLWLLFGLLLTFMVSYWWQILDDRQP